MSTGTRLRIWTLVIIIAIIYLVTRFGVGLYVDLLWFQHLDFESIFLISLWAKVGVGLAVAIPFALVFLINTLIARWQSVRNVLFFSEETMVAQKIVMLVIWAATLLLSWMVGSAASSNWLLFLRFLNQQPFDQADPTFNADPIFNMNVGFYVFNLPFYHFVQTWLIIAIFLALIGSLVIYAVAQQNNLTEGRLIILPHVQLHLSVLGALIFFTFAWGHWLDLFDLMYSPRGVAFGASYTDVNVSVPALWVMIAVAIASGVILLINTIFRRPALSLLAVFIWIIAGIVGTALIPGLIQRWVVEPNELARETQYIENNISFTNVAYGLNEIQERDFSQLEPLTRQKLTDHEATLKNVRLWDYRPLQQTYQQIQSIRPYYRFFDIDLDRYVIDGELRQIALAARELDKNQLQQPTWVTRKMQFTHSYGVVANPVNEVTREGLPELWVKDLPPTPKPGVDLSIERPEIYYSEAVGDYVFVQTGEREFNYPSGNENIYADYEGAGGVVLNSYLRRLAFALHLSDMNMLLSQEFTPGSRVLLHRNIQERVRRVAPFLDYDQDPYLVIGTDGRLYWIQDAYTTSNRFPYSEPSRHRAFGVINYIRNSVKVVIEAYDGSLTFYMVDPNEPLLKTYATIFPHLFTSMNQMPDWLQAHLRYPEDLFRIQTAVYQTYHMRDVNVFYNKEDSWEVPKEIVEEGTQPVEPYYVILRLPDEPESEFMLIQPFAPHGKENLIAWVAARSDGEHYGELIVYRFSKQELIFGTSQIEGRIDQNPEISSQMTLWGQSGSKVIRGNLLVLPLGNSLLYVEPLYLRAEQGQIPELKRVIVASGDKIVMKETLAESLAALFEDGGPGVTVAETPPAAEAEEPAPEAASSEADQEAAGSATTETAPATEPLSDDVNELAVTASEHYEAAQKALQDGDWAAYGQELEKMKAALDKLIGLTGGE